MFSSLFTKTLYNLRWQALGWSLAVGFIAFITMAFYNSFDQTGIEGIINSVPESLRSLVGSIDDFKTIPGYIGQQIFGPNIVILTIAMGIILFVSISASEEDDGRLHSLLSMPITRTAVFWQKLLAVLLVIALACAFIVAGLTLALPIIDKSVDFARVWQSAFDCWLMTTAYGMVAFAMAMLTGKKGLTIAAASGYAALSFIISSLAPAVDSLKTVDKFSIFHYYNNPQVMQSGLDAGHVLVLASIIVGLVLVGWFGFTRRSVAS
jgi:putative exporter of polyketide antibiotics